MKRRDYRPDSYKDDDWPTLLEAVGSVFFLLMLFFGMPWLFWLLGLWMGVR